MNTIRITIDIETINIDADTLKARIVAAIERGDLCFEDNLKESCEADPDSVAATVMD